VRAGDDAVDRDPGRLDRQGAFGALFAAVDRGPAGSLAAAGGLDDAAIDG